MSEIEFVKINGKDVAFIDEITPDFTPIDMIPRSPIPLRCGCDVLPGQFVSPNERGEIVPSDGSNICGIVVEARGDYALVQIDY